MEMLATFMRRRANATTDKGSPKIQTYSA